MPTDWVSQNTLTLIAQIDQFVTALNNPGGLAASGLTAGHFTALTAAKTDLQTKYTAQLAAMAASDAAVDAAEGSQASTVALFRADARAANASTTMTDAYRNAAGLTVRDTHPSPGDLPVIDDLAAIGRPSGNNFLDWGTPHGVAAGIVWEIQTAPGTSGPWTIVGTTSRTDWLHESAGAGVHRLYRVIATRGNRRGEPGNEASVYG